MPRSIFFISDGTGITAETLGRALLTQFQDLPFKQVSMPFVNDMEKLEWAIKRIERAHETDAEQPVVFCTIIQRELRERLTQCHAVVIDFFEAFTGRLEQVLGRPAAHVAGRFHGMGNAQDYGERISAVHYALDHDDGVTTRDFEKADIILVGVSRTGKTPVSLYLALNHGIQAANYPFSDDDFVQGGLPDRLEPFRAKLFGLTIQPDRLQQIRQERRPNSRYADPEQVRNEIRAVEQLYRRERIPFLDVTYMSVEEIATSIIQQAGLQRRL
ncbi:MAG: pyruvate, water dikinase regulatory protein [Ectothiorhodospiraceae bacterium]|jgi:regulator of PEP synthase PpsR (kinase-PPPase family)|nr:pyruvate, water dikinase regulatory protein [Ectothiorhodospiraceae bacterium]